MNRSTGNSINTNMSNVSKMYNNNKNNIKNINTMNNLATSAVVCVTVVTSSQLGSYGVGLQSDWRHAFPLQEVEKQGIGCNTATVCTKGSHSSFLPSRTQDGNGWMCRQDLATAKKWTTAGEMPVRRDISPVGRASPGTPASFVSEATYIMYVAGNGSLESWMIHYKYKINPWMETRSWSGTQQAVHRVTEYRDV